MNRHSQGDEFAQVYEEHIWHVYAYLAYRVGSRERAEDLTQTTFERAYRAWGRFDPARSQPRTWLLAIAQNALVDDHRRGSRRREISLEDASFEPSTPGPEGVGMPHDLAAALSDLSERDRQVIALKFGGDLSGQEIASILGTSVGNVHQILSRALRRLRSLLDP